MGTTAQQTTRRNGRFDTRRQRRRGAEGGQAQTVRAAGGGHETLEDLILSAAQAIASGSSTCPVCRAPELTKAGCRCCGAQLS